jgi:hypothetical protein
MQAMLNHALGDGSTRVERLALGQSPLRASHALLENYVVARGAPKIVILEIMFMTQRSVDRLAARGLDLPPEQYIYRRDLNLMSFRQILRMPAVAMPFSEPEGVFNLWRFRLRGVVLRAGALVYNSLRHPMAASGLADCDRASWTREPEWPPDFAFAYGDFEPRGNPSDVIAHLRKTMADLSPTRSLKTWQLRVATGQRYPYDFTQEYRRGEVAILDAMIQLATRHGSSVLLLPLPLYGYGLDQEDMREFAALLPARVQLFDLYGNIDGELRKFWYDDGHLEPHPAGAMATAVLAQHLLDSGLLSGGSGPAGND